MASSFFFCEKLLGQLNRIEASDRSLFDEEEDSVSIVRHTGCFIELCER